MSTTTTVPAPETKANPTGWAPLAVITCAHLMAVLDTTIMFVALPSIQHGLHMTTATRLWVVTAYTLALAGLLLLGGRLADRFGARRTLVVGVAGFALASAIGGASVDAAMLITARAVQGAFGAILVSSTKSLLITVYDDGRQRAKVMGIFTSTLTAGMAIGLVLGGVITSGLDWRWCLYLNLILSAVALIGAFRVLPSLPGRPEVRIDAVSAVLATGAMATLIYGLGEASSLGWSSARIVTALVAAAVLGGAFGLRQARHAFPLLPTRVVLDRNRGLALLGLIVNAISTFGMMLILTYQLQSVMRYSALMTGLALVPFAVSTGIGSALIAPRLMLRVAPRWLIAAGLVLSAAGLVPLVFLHPSSGFAPLILLATVIEGIGGGLCAPSALNTSLAGVLPTDRGSAGAATSAASQLGSSIGAAVISTIAASATAGYLAGHAHAGAVTATEHGFAVAMIWGAVIMLAGALPIAWWVKAGVPAGRR